MHLLECISSKILNHLIPDPIRYHREGAICMGPVAGPETMVCTYFKAASRESLYVRMGGG